ncbi:hypothetical protein ACOMHN_014171 [Nucella lapillus]
MGVTEKNLGSRTFLGSGTITSVSTGTPDSGDLGATWIHGGGDPARGVGRAAMEAGGGGGGEGDGEESKGADGGTPSEAKVPGVDNIISSRCVDTSQGENDTPTESDITLKDIADFIQNSLVKKVDQLDCSLDDLKQCMSTSVVQNGNLGYDDS